MGTDPILLRRSNLHSASTLVGSAGRYLCVEVWRLQGAPTDVRVPERTSTCLTCGILALHVSRFETYSTIFPCVKWIRRMGIYSELDTAESGSTSVGCVLGIFIYRISPCAVLKKQMADIQAELVYMQLKRVITVLPGVVN